VRANWRAGPTLSTRVFTQPGPEADSNDLQNGKVPATVRRVRWYVATCSEQGTSKLTC
jgi:hypothetical protein